MSIILTGAGGFLGKSVRNHVGDRSLIAIDAIPSRNGEWHCADVGSPMIEAFLPKKIETVIHLAALANDRLCRENPVRAWETNVAAAVRFYQSCADRGCGTFIFASSEWVYGDSGSNVARKEDENLTMEHLGTYALTKLAAEFALKQVERDTCKLLIFRLGILFGSRSSGLSAVESVAQSVVANKLVQVGSADTARCYLHVDDAAIGIFKACDAGLNGVYNLAGDALISLRDVYRTATALTGHKPGLVASSSGACTVRNLDISALTTVLAWKPQPFATGLRTVIASMGGSVP